MTIKNARILSSYDDKAKVFVESRTELSSCDYQNARILSSYDDKASASVLVER